MWTKSIAACAFAAALAAAPALAQTSPPAGSQPAEKAEAQKPPADLQFMTQPSADMWRASQLEGLDVYNSANEKIGDISEVLVDKQGAIKAVVIGVGGFLGIGQRDVAVPFDKLQFSMTPRQTAATGTGTGAGTGTGTGTAAGRTAAPPATSSDKMATGATGSTEPKHAPDHAILANVTKDQLKNAPEFKYSR